MMNNAEKMWHAWFNSPQGQAVADYHLNNEEVLASMKFAFIAGFEVAMSLPTPEPR